MHTSHDESTPDNASNAGDIALPAYREDQLAQLAPAELMDLLTRDEDRVPRMLIDECARRGDAMAEQFGIVIENDRMWDGEAGAEEAWLPLHTVMILGLVPTERAGRLLVSIMRRMEQAGDDDLQDWLSGYWPALFRNKPEAILPALRELAQDRGVDWYMRTQAGEVIVAAAEQAGAEEVDAALDWATGIAADETENWDMRLCMGGTLLDFPRARYRALLEGLADRQSRAERHFSRDEIEQAYASAQDDPEWRRFEDPWEFYQPQAIVERQERWAREDAEAESGADDDDMIEDPALPYVRPLPKIGRNDPCPCGSGKKYKKCCLVQVEG